MLLWSTAAVACLSSLAGRDGYEVSGGSVSFLGKDLLDMGPEERACEGVFLAFQYPVEIPGVNSTYFLKSAVNAVRKYRGKPELDAVEFLALVKEKRKILDLPEDFLKRPVNEGFSGGEKKRNEIFRWPLWSQNSRFLMRPTQASISTRSRSLRMESISLGADSAQIVITHYQRLLDYSTRFVHACMMVGSFDLGTKNWLFS